jgi:hypothetical protein
VNLQRTIRYGLLACLALGAAQISRAGPCEDLSSAKLGAVPALPASAYLTAVQPCFGKPGDDAPVVVKFNAALVGADTVDLRVKRALNVIVAAVESSQLPLGSGPANAKVRERLKDAIRGVSVSAPPGIDSVGPQAWDWSVAAGLPPVPELALDDDLAKACTADLNDATCVAARETAHAWLRVAAMTRLALGEYSRDYLAGMAALSARRVKMWHAYRDEALPQYPWEYWLNSKAMERADTRPLGPDKKNPLGYETIPTSQFIFLHPGASLEWRDARQESTDSKAIPALYVELFGINRWSFDSATGEMIGGKGISIIVSYANRDGAKSTGYGLMFHSRLTKQFTLGITRAGDETVYLVNVDLAEYFKQKLGYWKEIQKKIDGGL